MHVCGVSLALTFQMFRFLSTKSTLSLGTMSGLSGVFSSCFVSHSFVPCIQVDSEVAVTPMASPSPALMEMEKESIAHLSPPGNTFLTSPCAALLPTLFSLLLLVQQ